MVKFEFPIIPPAKLNDEQMDELNFLAGAKEMSIKAVEDGYANIDRLDMLNEALQISLIEQTSIRITKLQPYLNDVDKLIEACEKGFSEDIEKVNEKIRNAKEYQSATDDKKTELECEVKRNEDEIVKYDKKIDDVFKRASRERA